MCHWGTWGLGEPGGSWHQLHRPLAGRHCHHSWDRLQHPQVSIGRFKVTFNCENMLNVHQKSFIRRQLEDLCVDLAAFPRLCPFVLSPPSSTRWVACNCSWSFWSGSHQAGRDLPGSATLPAGGKAKPQTALHQWQVVSHPINSFSYIALQLLHLLDRPGGELCPGQMLQQLLGWLPLQMPPDDEEADFEDQV